MVGCIGGNSAPEKKHENTMNTNLLAKFLTADRPTLDGWEREPVDNLEQAVLYRLARLASRGTFDRDFAHEEIAELQAAVGSPEPSITFSGDHPECAYHIFGDGSLYYANNAQDEVWADARDFVIERVLDRGAKDACDFPAMSDEGKLIRQVAAGLL